MQSYWSLLLGSAPLHIRQAQTAAVQRVGQVAEVATERLQLRQRLLALQPRQPLRWQTLHHLKEEQREVGAHHADPAPGAPEEEEGRGWNKSLSHHGQSQERSQSVPLRWMKSSLFRRHGGKCEPSQTQQLPSGLFLTAVDCFLYLWIYLERFLL